MTSNNSLGIDRVRGDERIAALDIIRGFAILFILMMNVTGMGTHVMTIQDFRYPSWTAADYWTTWSVSTFLDGTQRGLLELLFGAGILIMARRAMTPDGPVAVADLHFRRNLWLIAFGLFNALVLMWWGDILLPYGIAACFLFPFRTMRPRGQLLLALALLGALTAAHWQQHARGVAMREQMISVEARLAAGKPVSAEDRKKAEERRKDVERFQTLPANHPETVKKIQAADKAHHSTLAAYWSANLETWKLLTGPLFWEIEGEIVATMLLGMALFQLGLLQGKARTSTYLALLIVGYGVGCTLRGLSWSLLLGSRDVSNPYHWLMEFSRLGVTLGHLALIHLLLRARAGQWLLRPFAAAGRMPLTIYLFTSLLMGWVIFAPWGLGLWGKLGAVQQMQLALAVIAAELIAANLWMRGFVNGPMEWLWKSLAYERREPFRRQGDRTELDPLPVPTA